MIVFLLSEITCAIFGNWYSLYVFMRLISGLTKIKIFIARLIAIKIFNRLSALVVCHVHMWLRAVVCQTFTTRSQASAPLQHRSRAWCWRHHWCGLLLRTVLHLMLMSLTSCCVGGPWIPLSNVPFVLRKSVLRHKVFHSVVENPEADIVLRRLTQQTTGWPS